MEGRRRGKGRRGGGGRRGDKEKEKEKKDECTRRRRQTRTTRVTELRRVIALYLMTTETFIPTNLSKPFASSIVAVHLSCLTLICVLVFAIRTLVEQYEKMYLEEIKANKSLIEKNKSSYDLVAMKYLNRVYKYKLQ